MLVGFADREPLTLFSTGAPLLSPGDRGPAGLTVVSDRTEKHPNRRSMAGLPAAAVASGEEVGG